jgi:DNA-binding MarR family transcriptional regulator
MEENDMLTLGPALKMIMNQSMVQSVLSKKLDAQLSMHGISFTEFMILYHLHNAENEKMRRIDLAEKTGLSASGITRLIAPMEKIGLVQREANQRDARVSFVKLAPGGARILQESASGVDILARQLLTGLKPEMINAALQTLTQLGGTIR